MNFSLKSALSSAFALSLALFTGCGQGDGRKEYAVGEEACRHGDMLRAEKLFTESAECDPANVDALVMLARVKKDLGKIEEAVATVAKAAVVAEGHLDVMMLEGEIAYLAKDYDLARRRFTAVAENNALDAAVRSLAWTGLGIVEMSCIGIDRQDMEKRALSRIAFLRAVRLDRRNASARYHLGLLYRNAYGYLDAALEQFNIFVRLLNVADSRVEKAQRVLIPEIKDEIARRAAARPGASSRDSSASANALARAEAAWKKNQFKTARVEYDRAFAADVLSYPAALGLAKAWAKTDSTEFGRKKAFEYYKTACSLRYSAVSTFLTAGELAMKLGQWASAAEIYSRAIAANPSDISAIDGLIRALRKSGGKATIASAYQLYRESIPIRRN